MDDRLRQQLEQILEQVEVEEKSEIFLKQAIAIGIPPEDGAWLKSMFRLAAMFLELAYGDKKEANRALPWLLFSLGMAYERYYAQKKGYNGGSKKMTAKVHLSKKELNDLIEAGKAAGNDTSQLEALLAEVAPEKLAGSKARPISGRELELAIKRPEELVTSSEELERLRTLACPHIRDSLFWEEFVSRCVLVCTSCEQPALFDF